MDVHFIVNVSINSNLKQFKRNRFLNMINSDYVIGISNEEYQLDCAVCAIGIYVCTH